MQPVKHLWRGLFFILLIASLCGAMVLPAVSAPARAAPNYANALDVVINEVAWAGTAASQSDEWIELYNPTAFPILLTNWRLTDNGDINKTLAGSIPAGGYFLLERTDDNTVSDIPADITYSGGMANGGESLYLYDELGNLIDSANLDGGAWPGGIASPTFGSMERVNYLIADSDTNWQTNNGIVRNGLDGGTPPSPINGTPKQINSVTPPSLALTTTVMANLTGTAGSGLTATAASDLTGTAASNLTLTSIALSITSTATTTLTATSTAVAPLTILINEVAWSGTAASTNDEWFELYNPGSTPINLNGWRLQAADGNPNIPLSGTILPGDYFVVAPDAGIFNTPLVDLTYPSGSFNNNGEVLSLLDPAGNPVDTANSAGGNWPAGTASPTYASMERKGLAVDSATAWSTYGGTTPVAFDRNGGPVRGTPGQANWITTVTATPTVTPTLTLTTTGVATTPTPANVVISEFRTTGPNGGNDEFVEIYNRTTSPVSIASWEIRKSSGCGTSVEKVATIPAGVTLNPGQHYLIGGSSYSGSVTVNLTSNLGIADTGGIALFQPGGTAWVDAVGLCSSTTFREGTALTQLTGNTNRGYDRKASSAGICVDTNNNINDFFLRTPSDPQNLASPVTICGNPTPTPTRTPRPTPTRTNTPVPPPPLIAINEFVPRPGHDWNGDSLINFGDEYIELINHGVIDVNLSGYTLDDEVNIGSPPFRLPADVTMKPGERRVFFAGETGLRLSDGGDGVRLLKPNGQLGDAYNYTVVRFPDQSYCRLPDNGGLDDWNQNCYPTPNLQNSLNGTLVTPPVSTGEETACPFSDTFPQDFAIVLAECPTFGDSIWNAAYWDRNGWFGERFLPESPGKWNVFVD